MARMSNLNLVLRFDTKKVEKVNIKVLTEQLVLSISSPDIENLICRN